VEHVERRDNGEWSDGGWAALLALGEPLVTAAAAAPATAAGEQAGVPPTAVIHMTHARALAIEEVKRDVRRSAHGRGMARRAQALDDALAEVVATAAWVESGAGGDGAPPAGVPPHVFEEHRRYLAARGDHAATVALCRAWFRGQAQPLLRAAAAAAARAPTAATTATPDAGSVLPVPEGVSLSTPFLAGLRVLLETQLWLSADATSSLPGGGGGGGGGGGLPNVAVGWILEDEVLSEVVGATEDAAGWTTDLARLLVLTLGITPVELVPPAHRRHGGGGTTGAVRCWTLSRGMSDPLVHLLLSDCLPLPRPTHTVHAATPLCAGPPSWRAAADRACAGAATLLAAADPTPPALSAAARHVAVLHYASLLAAGADAEGGRPAAADAAALLDGLTAGGDLSTGEHAALAARVLAAGGATHRPHGPAGGVSFTPPPPPPPCGAPGLTGPRAAPGALVPAGPPRGGPAKSGGAAGRGGGAPAPLLPWTSLVERDTGAPRPAAAATTTRWRCVML